VGILLATPTPSTLVVVAAPVVAVAPEAVDPATGLTVECQAAYVALVAYSRQGWGIRDKAREARCDAAIGALLDRRATERAKVEARLREAARLRDPAR